MIRASLIGQTTARAVRRKVLREYPGMLYATAGQCNDILRAAPAVSRYLSHGPAQGKPLSAGCASVVKLPRADSSEVMWDENVVTKDMVALGFKELDKTAEMEEGNLSSSRFDFVQPVPINILMKMWRSVLIEQIKNDSEITTLLPSEVCKKVDRYGRLQSVSHIRPDHWTYSFIINAAVYVNDLDNGIYAVDKWFNNLVERLYQETRAGKKLSMHLPDRIAVVALTDAWRRVVPEEAPSVAEFWITNMNKLSRHPIWKSLKPDGSLYVSAIVSCTAVRDFRGAMRWMKEIEKNGIQPNQYTYESLSFACRQARNEDIAQAQITADEIWNQMQRNRVLPTQSIFLNILKCWTRMPKSKSKQAAERANQVIQTMEDLARAGHVQLHPVTKTYHQAMVLYSRARQPQLCEDLFEKMLLKLDQGYTTCAPNEATCIWILNAWSLLAAHGNSRAADRAEVIFKKFFELYEEGKIRKPPGSKCFGLLMSCWAQTGGPKSGPRVQELLGILKYRVAKGLEPDPPNISHYNTIAMAWARMGDPLNAEMVLDEALTEYFLRGNEQVKPDERLFGCVIGAWVKRPSLKSAVHAEHLLNRIIDLREMGRLDVKPNVIMYTSVISCWARASENDAHCQQAQKWFDVMKNSKDLDLRPNIVTYTSLIACYCRNGNPMRAEELIYEAIDLYRETRDDQLEPNMAIFDVVLRAWATSDLVIAGERAEALLAEVSKLNKEGITRFRPDLSLFNSVLICWARSNKEGAAERAEAILRALEDFSSSTQDRSLSPNAVIYNTVLSAWANAVIRLGDDSAFVRMEQLLKEMIAKSKDNKNMAPVALTFRIMMDAIHAYDLPDKNKKFEDLIEVGRQFGFQLDRRGG